MEINFEELKQEAIKAIGKNKIMILATSAGNRVTARAMSCVSDGLKIYFQTGTDSLKYRQMKENPIVALCAANMQIEGKAVFKNQSLSENDFIAKYKKDHYGSFTCYSAMKTSFVVEVVPVLITFWKYTDKKPHRDILDLVNSKATRVPYDTSNTIC